MLFEYKYTYKFDSDSEKRLFFRQEAQFIFIKYILNSQGAEEKIFLSAGIWRLAAMKRISRFICLRDK